MSQRRRTYLLLALLLWVFAIALALVGTSLAQDSLTVPCRPDKCRMLVLWNELPKLEGDRYASVEKLQAGLIADPPGLVRSLDREDTLKELISSSEQLTKIYREMLDLERK